MLDLSNETKPTAVHPWLLAEQVWDEILRLYVDWANADRMRDAADAMRIEQEFRFFALHYASLEADEGPVSTGRKAVIRAIYARLGTVDMTNVIVMLDAVIGRETAAGQR